jgi:HEAT repeat protein
MGEPTQFTPRRADSEQGSAWLRLWPQFAAVVAGAVLAVVVSGAGGSAVWQKITGTIAKKSSAGSASISHGVLANRELAGGELTDGELDRQKPQKQAEILLERAVSHSSGATAQIEARVNAWQGKLQWDSQLGDLTTVALNSSDQGVRASAIEVQLAAYGLAKSESTFDRLVSQAQSSEHAQKIWALWGLGLLGNRGIESERVVQVLSAQLKGSANQSGQNRSDQNQSDQNQSDEDARRWAVEGLALVGTTSTIEPLLEAMHNDPSPVVRERAACSLAESGMLSHEQRMSSVPRLIDYSDDSALDGQTRGLAFEALKEITKQPLADDSAAWREWYRRSVSSGQ